MIRFGSFYFYETFICYRGCLNLNCYIGKKVQKNFLMGLKIWWSWGSRIFFSKSANIGRFSIFHAKLQFLERLGALFGQFFVIFWVFFSCKTSVFWEAGCSFWVKKILFFMKNFNFCGAGCFFWSIFCQFFVIFLCKTSVFWEVGWSFWVKNTIFFMQNFGFYGAGWYFWYLFVHFLSIFFNWIELS